GAACPGVAGDGDEGRAGEGAAVDEPGGAGGAPGAALSLGVGPGGAPGGGCPGAGAPLPPNISSSLGLVCPCASTLARAETRSVGTAIARDHLVVLGMGGLSAICSRATLS